MRSDQNTVYFLCLLKRNVGRDIPEGLAAKTDRDNEFPAHMWRKLGDAG